MYYKYEIDRWINHRLKDIALTGLPGGATHVVDLLPHGWDSVYPGLAGEAVLQMQVDYPILTFVEAGIVPIGGVIGIMKDGVSANYLIDVWHADPSYADAAVILAAVDKTFIAPDGNGVGEVYNSLAFEVFANNRERGDINITQAGVLYTRAGLGYQIDVAPAA